MIENKINIGLLIEQKLNELGISKSELARRTGIANQNVNRILSKSSIDTDKLISISKALDYNFFEDYIGERNAVVNGDGSVAVSGNNNSNVVAGGDGTALLQERIRHLEDLLSEKERLIKLYEKMAGEKE